MAILSKEQAQELLTAQRKAKLIQAVEHEERLVLHCEALQHKTDLPDAYGRFLAWVQSMLIPDKFERFKQLLGTPLETVESTEAIFDEISKFYEADNKYVKFDFVSSEIEEDANEYAQKIKDNDFWHTKAWEAMKTGVNSILVVDLPKKQTSERPEPYYYLVPIKKVVDIVFNEAMDAIEYVAYKNKSNEIIVIDDRAYWTFIKNEQTSEWEFSSEAIHSVYDENGKVIFGLGYCPARSFMSTPVKGMGGVDNTGPISSSLAKLDWLLFTRTSKKYLELYAAWPIFVTYKSDCHYRDENDNSCIEGFVNYELLENDVLKKHQKACPVCSAKKAVGPGSWWEVDAPDDASDVDLLKNPMTIIEMSNEKLDYWTTEIARMEDEIYGDCVGWDGDALNTKAVNETQVSANFQSKDNVLTRWKTVIEKSHKWAMDTVYILRYADYFIRSTVNYGTEFFLQTPAELTDLYGKSKTSGLPMYMIASMRDKISRTQHRNNPDELQRNYILSQLEPYPDFTLAQLQSMQIQFTDPANYILKVNFPTFIQKFEREQSNIIEFGSLISFDNKINSILNILLSYGKDQQSAIPQPEPRGNGGVTV